MLSKSWGQNGLGVLQYECFGVFFFRYKKFNKNQDLLVESYALYSLLGVIVVGVLLPQFPLPFALPWLLFPISSCHLSRDLLLAFMKKLLTVLSSSPSCWAIVTCISLVGLFVSLKIACNVRRWMSVKTRRGFLMWFCGCWETLASSSFFLQAAEKKGRNNCLFKILRKRFFWYGSQTRALWPLSLSLEKRKEERIVSLKSWGRDFLIMILRLAMSYFFLSMWKQKRKWLSV